MIQIGSIVTITRMNEEGEWVVPDGPIIEGTVIGMEAEDCDGCDKIESLTIRWEDGRVETRKPEGADMLSDWEIADCTPKLYANLYLHDREYGGPQEGGWWYDTYSPVSRDCGDWDTEPPTFGLLGSVEAAEEATEALKAWCDWDNRNRRSPSSVASEGHYCARLESWPPEYSPSQRPYYC